MTEILSRIQRHITTATGMPTCLNRPDVAPADSAEGRAGVESVLEPAVTVPSKKIAEQWIALLRPRRLFMHSRADERAAKYKHYPHHNVFIEQALMAREMERC